MNWEREFKSQDYGRPCRKYGDWPIYETDEFDFYRCVEFKQDFYGQTASTLFAGNLRSCFGRYAKLFPNQNLSYWADSPATARAEIKKHGAGKDILTFWAYDDASSTFPILPDQSPLVIIDGRTCGVQELIDKADSDMPLSEHEKQVMEKLLSTEPDCLVYDSHARKGGENYIFFEKGFRKLALRQLRLRLGQSGGNHNRIDTAYGCDYAPIIEHYGEYFASKARVQMDESYLNINEYFQHKDILEKSYARFNEATNS